MCLYINKDAEIKTAKRNIICWKKLKLSNESEFRGFEYEMGVKYDIPEGMATHINEYDRLQVERAFHSWENKPSNHSFSYKIVICVIPKGSTYFEGTQHDCRDGYASDAIIVYDYTKWYQKIKFWFNYLSLSLK